MWTPVAAYHHHNHYHSSHNSHSQYQQHQHPNPHHHHQDPIRQHPALGHLPNPILPPPSTLRNPQNSTSPPQCATVVTGYHAELGTLQLEIVEQPVHARMSGIKMRSHRYVDPVPILKLSNLSGDWTTLALRTPFFICHAKLISHKTDDFNTIGSEIYYPNTNAPSGRPGSQATTVMMGELTAPCKIFKDLNGTLGAFFYFNFLAIRASGLYKLRFDLFDLSLCFTGRGSSAIASCLSNPFRVYAPRMFPGVQETTELAKHFSKQGAKMIVRGPESIVTCPDGTTITSRARGKVVKGRKRKKGDGDTHEAPADEDEDIGDDESEDNFDEDNGDDIVALERAMAPIAAPNTQSKQKKQRK